jgi:hypothetical protein
MKPGSRNRNILLFVGVCIAILVLLYLFTPSFDLTAISTLDYRTLVTTLGSKLADVILSNFPF